MAVVPPCRRAPFLAVAAGSLLLPLTSLPASAVPAAVPVVPAAPEPSAAQGVAPGSEEQARVSAAAKAKKPLSKKCRKRLTKPRRKVTGKTFATCVLKAQKAARTVVIRTAYDDGSVAKGPYRFGATTDASVTANDGTDLVALGKNFWQKVPGRGWVKGEQNSSDPDRQLVWIAGQLWRQSSSPASYRKVLASSKSWKPTGKVKKINGVRARQYSGNPRIRGVVVDDYTVWLDSGYRPVRVTSVTTAFGFSTTMKQDFTRWGKKVVIAAPTR